MNWLRAAIRNVLHLFIDDGWLAAAVLLWLLIAWLCLPRLPLPAAWDGVVLFFGLAVILFGSVWWRVRR